MNSLKQKKFWDTYKISGDMDYWEVFIQTPRLPGDLIEWNKCLKSVFFQSHSQIPTTNFAPKAVPSKAAAFLSNTDAEINLIPIWKNVNWQVQDNY